MWRGCIRVTAALCVLVAACADDAYRTGGAGARDAGPDAQRPTPPPRDAAAAGETLRLCERSEPGGCGAGETCRVLARWEADAGAFIVEEACVEADRARGRGDPCTPWGGFETPYEREGLTGKLYLDPCGVGLHCAPHPELRGVSSCQTSCATGRFGDAPRACADPAAYCVGEGALQEVCLASDGCDVAAQTGCRPGEACYLRAADDGRGLLAVCLAPPQPGVAPLSSCAALNDCAPGSSCLGSITAPPARWTSDDYRCRSVCEPSQVELGDDAGSAIEGCPPVSTCRAFSDYNIDIIGVSSPPYGQCER